MLVSDGEKTWKKSYSTIFWGGGELLFADVVYGGGVSWKSTYADMGEGGVQKWQKNADVLNGRPLKVVKSN